MSRTFQRKKEDFVCIHCGALVKGTGYTNHCPQCLWSRHVDIHPGDRAALCGGLMEPIAVEMVRGTSIVVHKCTHCGYEKRNKTDALDNVDMLVHIAQKR